MAFNQIRSRRLRQCAARLRYPLLACVLCGAAAIGAQEADKSPSSVELDRRYLQARLDVHKADLAYIDSVNSRTTIIPESTVRMLQLQIAQLQQGLDWLAAGKPLDVEEVERLYAEGRIKVLATQLATTEQMAAAGVVPKLAVDRVRARYEAAKMWLDQVNDPTFSASLEERLMWQTLQLRGEMVDFRLQMQLNRRAR